MEYKLGLQVVIRENWACTKVEHLVAAVMFLTMKTFLRRMQLIRDEVGHAATRKKTSRMTASAEP